MTDVARALLDAKLALEAELVRPLTVIGEEYIVALHENGGRPLPAFSRMQHVERLEMALRRHYARVALVMAGKRPPRDPSIAEAALSMRHETSMHLRARDQAQRIIASIEREMEREIARTDPPVMVDDGTGHPVAKSEDDAEIEIKADRERITGVTAGMVGRYRARVPAIANVNTNAPAEEARLAALLDELDVIRPGERLVQTWNSLLDGRERPAHHAAHGQTRPVDEPFEVGGELLRFPGDSSLGASVGNTINCRCFLVTHAEDESGNRRLIHTGPSAPARRMKRPNETLEQAKPRLNPTANIRLNGRSRATLVLHDKNKTIAQLQQVKPNLIEVRVGNRVIARAETNPTLGTVEKISVSPAWQRNGSDVEGIIRRSVALSAQPRP
jgi:hypothetical protein